MARETHTEINPDYGGNPDRPARGGGQMGRVVFESIEDVDVELDNKQDIMLNEKQEFFTSNEGVDGDTGICHNNGKAYMSVKIKGNWHFSELKQAKDL